MDYVRAVKNLSKKYGISRKFLRDTDFSAKTVIPKMCYNLKGKGFTNETIKATVRHDLTDWELWCRKTIDDHIPKQFLDPERIARGKRVAMRIKAKNPNRWGPPDPQISNVMRHNVLH